MRMGSSLRRSPCCARPCSAPTTASGSRLRDETSEPTLAAAVFGERLLQDSAVEVGPVGGNEYEFAVGRLPQQEVGEPLLAAGADDEVGIRQIRRVEKAGQRFGRHLLRVGSPGLDLGEETPGSAGDFLAGSVVECNDQHQPVV